ncbi:MiaB/RimO family radical SAM methylthiotransferase, partial [Patescibacteria group bacterium]|nr:MiaB/RimO family radical SAM methylthiotransferase [Patescibacteria group bacterium]
MKYLIITFGCQMNRSDSERIASVLEQANLEEALEIKEANFIVINMCSVRQSAVDRVNGIFENTKNQKSAKILTGCVLTKDAKKFAEKFDYILDIKDLPKWPKILNLNQSHGLVRETINYFGIEAKQVSKFSATVPIMTGCNNFCTYCVVPYTRDREISRPHKEIIYEIEKLVKNGYKEIWLLGQNVNSYSDISFSELLRKINKISGKFWVRFTSSHPKDFSNDLIKTIKDCDKVTEYLNLPVQSGDDEILKKMNRPYKIKKYLEIIKKVRKEIPSICISTDVIVGFPGETKKQFQNTAQLFKEVKYDMA